MYYWSYVFKLIILGDWIRKMDWISVYVQSIEFRMGFLFFSSQILIDYNMYSLIIVDLNYFMSNTVRVNR